MYELNFPLLVIASKSKFIYPIHWKNSENFDLFIHLFKSKIIYVEDILKFNTFCEPCGGVWSF